MAQSRTASDSAGERKPPALSLRESGGGFVLRISGEWTALTVGRMEKDLRRELAEAGTIREVNVAQDAHLDTTGALLLHEVAKERNAKVVTADEAHERLFSIASEAGESCLPETKQQPIVLRFVNGLGRSIIEESRLGLRMIGFFGEYLVTCVRIFKNPKSLPLTSLVYHMEQVGVSAVPIVALLSFLIGLVIAYMGAQQLAMFGAEIFVINLVEITTLRELGVLLTSIVIAGRSGSSFTAQIGAMVSNEEVAAMRTMGFSPMLRLAFPRITALVLMLPALVFLADIMGILGGGVAAWTKMDMTPQAYAVRMQQVVQTGNFMVGMVKAPFFAVVIGVIGCFQGFQVTGSAESVGRLTTRSVVEAIFMVIVLDAMFALFFTGIGV